MFTMTSMRPYLARMSAVALMTRSFVADVHLHRIGREASRFQCVRDPVSLIVTYVAADDVGAVFGKCSANFRAQQACPAYDPGDLAA